MIKLLKMYCLMLLCSKNEEYYRNKTFEVNSSEITVVSNIFKQTKIVSEYDQEIPQSQTADNPVTPRGRAAQPSRDPRKTN